MSNPYLIEIKKSASLLVSGPMACFDECAFPFQGSMEGKVTVIPIKMSLKLLGFGMVPPSMPPTTVLPVVLPTLLDLGTKLPRSQLLTPESIKRAVLGDQVQFHSLLSGADLGF